MYILSLPTAEIAAAAIISLTMSVSVTYEGKDGPEPYRAAAYALGWEPMDGTPWWDEVMDLI